MELRIISSRFSVEPVYWKIQPESLCYLFFFFCLSFSFSHSTTRRLKVKHWAKEKKFFTALSLSPKPWPQTQLFQTIIFPFHCLSSFLAFILIVKWAEVWNAIRISSNNVFIFYLFEDEFTNNFWTWTFDLR